MKNNSINLELIDGIYDIRPPLTPEPGFFESIAILMVIALIIVLTLYFLWKIFLSRKGIAKRKIARLLQDYKFKDINSRDATYQLCHLLQHGLSVNQISRETKLPEKLISEKDKWIIFTDKLTEIRYKNEYQSHDINSLIVESMSWLKAWS